MQSLLVIVILISMPTTGYLSVDAMETKVNVYLDGDLIGTTPIINYPIAPGEYSVSLYDSKSIENEYWQLKDSEPFQKIKSLWQLIRIGAATQRVKIMPNQTTKITFYPKRIKCAPTAAKIILGSSIISIFGIGVLTGVLVAK